MSTRICLMVENKLVKWKKWGYGLFLWKCKVFIFLLSLGRFGLEMRHKSKLNFEDSEQIKSSAFLVKLSVHHFLIAIFQFFIKKTLWLRIELSTHGCIDISPFWKLSLFGTATEKPFWKYSWNSPMVFTNKICFWNFKTIFTKMKMKVFSGASCRHRPKSGGGFLHTYLLHKTYSSDFTKLLKTFSPICKM